MNRKILLAEKCSGCRAKAADRVIVLLAKILRVVNLFKEKLDHDHLLFKLVGFFVLGAFFAVSTELFEFQFLRSIELIAACDIVLAFTNATHKRNHNPMFTFFGHMLVMSYEH